jgi:hypothetical protein
MNWSNSAWIRSLRERPDGEPPVACRNFLIFIGRHRDYEELTAEFESCLGFVNEFFSVASEREAP